MQSGKEESWEVFFFAPRWHLRSLKTARGSERGDRLEQVACQVADLALEMTEDALREASIYLRQLRLRLVCHGAGPPSFPNCRLRFLGPPGFGGNDQGGKGDRGLGQLRLRIGKRSGQPGGPRKRNLQFGNDGGPAPWHTDLSRTASDT